MKCESVIYTNQMFVILVIFVLCEAGTKTSSWPKEIRYLILRLFDLSARLKRQKHRDSGTSVWTSVKTNWQKMTKTDLNWLRLVNDCDIFPGSGSILTEMFSLCWMLSRHSLIWILTKHYLDEEKVKTTILWKKTKTNKQKNSLSVDSAASN